VANIKLAFGSVQTMVTTNLQSLASSTTTGAWQSASVDNSANLYLDALVIVTLVGPATVSADRAAYVYAYGSIDGGTTYPDAISGSEGALTFNSDPPQPQVDRVDLDAGQLGHLQVGADEYRSGLRRHPARSLGRGHPQRQRRGTGGVGERGQVSGGLCHHGVSHAPADSTEA
jgi:hypothetical protein